MATPSKFETALSIVYRVFLQLSGPQSLVPKRLPVTYLLMLSHAAKLIVFAIKKNTSEMPRFKLMIT
jgi:hypothetical protein